MSPAAAFFLGVALLCGVAGAQPRPPEEAAEEKALANSLAKEGVRAYRAGHHLAALSRFEQAYTLFPSPRLLYWLGQAYRQVGRPVDATESFERFLRGAGNVPGPVRARAERALASMRLQVARIEVVCPVLAAQVIIDGKSQGLTPLLGPVLVAAGPHEVLVQKPGRQTHQQRVDAAGGTVVQVQAELPPAPPGR